MMEPIFEAFPALGGWGVWIAVYLLLSLRYLVIAGLAFSVWYGWRRRRDHYKKIQQRFPTRTDYVREIAYSFLTFAVFAAVAVLVVAGPLRQYTQIYGDIGEFGWGYFCFSVLLMIVVHDTYFYWAHRAMHHPRIFRYVHLTHHRSTNPSPWAAFAFHPLEAVAEAGIIFFIAFLFPVHASALLLFLVFMTVYNVYGHLGWELFPNGFDRHGLGQWFNTSVNHNMHHEHFDANYGLYFTWWDKLMGSTHPDYHQTFERITRMKGPEVHAYRNG
jgi:sterol desaturase/sphingolipid hydroxylase (fatty acid hydroxylase superfamily)